MRFVDDIGINSIFLQTLRGGPREFAPNVYQSAHRLKKHADPSKSHWSPQGDFTSPSQHTSKLFSTSSSQESIEDDFDSLNFPTATVGTACIIGVVFLAVVFHRCYTNWKGSTRYHRQLDEEETSSTKTTIRISHSLPDLSQDIAKHEYIQEVQRKKPSIVTKDKKVLRQATLPTVPTRLQTFHRQLSQRLEGLSQSKPTKDFATKTLERTTSQKRKPPEDTIGLIQPELYREELVRQSSADSSSTDAEKVGKLNFSLRFDAELEVLIVKIIQATDLPAKDMTGSSDPYVKVYLLPDRKKKHVTKVHRRNLNPEFNETFLFSVTFVDLQERYLQFSVFDFDRFSRHDLIGQVVLKGLLDVNDLSNEINYAMDILAPPKDKQDLGELMVSLCYLPTAGRLTVTIIKARSLRAMDITGSSDPYCKVYLMCQGKKLRKRKTSVRRACLCPVWNESVVFDVPSESVHDVQLIFKVVDYDRIGRNEQLGVASAGSLCIGTGKDHWIEMLDNPRRPVAQWHSLQESIVPNAPLISNAMDATSPPDSPFVVDKPASKRHYSFGCIQGGKFSNK